MFDFMMSAFYVAVGVVCGSLAAVVLVAVGVSIYKQIKKVKSND